MNKMLLLLILVVSYSGFSQQLTYQTGGNVYDSTNQKLKPDAVRELMKKNNTALAAYNAGRNKKTWGNVLFYGGLGLATINLVSAVTMDTAGIDENGNYYSKKSTPTMAIIGGAMVLASIPIKAGYTKKIKSAINDYNEKMVSNEKVTPDILFVADSRGFGIRVSF
jgi:hypothetical protein